MANTIILLLNIIYRILSLSSSPFSSRRVVLRCLYLLFTFRPHNVDAAKNSVGASYQESKLELVLDGKPSGQLYVKKLFLPAGKLTVMCEAGRGLREVSAARRMDPYVVLKADGKV